jgi:hypothetical protein
VSDIARAALEAARTAVKARPRRTFRRPTDRAWSGAGPGAQDPQLLGQLAASLIGGLGRPGERERAHEDDWQDREESTGGA